MKIITFNSPIIKTWKLILIFISLTFTISCKKPDREVMLSVKSYIALLKANKYDSLDLSAFTYQDIPVLLKYRNETQIISNFPRNGISSLSAPKCNLGMYVLWTIESIRAVSINQAYLIKRFPSQNPILALRASNTLITINSHTSHPHASKAYFDWWENNKQKDYNEFKYVDPLKSTDYKWH